MKSRNLPRTLPLKVQKLGKEGETSGTLKFKLKKLKKNLANTPFISEGGLNGKLKRSFLLGKAVKENK